MLSFHLCKTGEGLYDFADALSGKYEQGVEREKIDSAMRMMEDGDLPLENV